MSQNHILVIEDEIHIQRILTTILGMHGFTTTVANDGEEGLTMLSQMDPLPDLILLDIMMPGIDGFQVLRSLRGSSRTKNLPVILLTALAQEGTVMEGAKLGVKDYLRKPFSPVELIERVNRVLLKQAG